MLRNLLFQVAQKTLNAEVRRRVEGHLVTTALVLFGLHLALYGAHAIWGLGLPDSLFAHPLQTLYTPFLSSSLRRCICWSTTSPPPLPGRWENKLKLWRSLRFGLSSKTLTPRRHGLGMPRSFRICSVRLCSVACWSCFTICCHGEKRGLKNLS